MLFGHRAIHRSVYSPNAIRIMFRDICSCVWFKSDKNVHSLV